MWGLNKQTLLFLVKITIIYLSWYILYRSWLYGNGTLDNLLINHLTFSIKSVLNLFGFQTFNNPGLVGINESIGVIVSEPCDGLSLFVVFAGFIFAYPGNFKNKLWFIPLGIILIDLLNILRIATLCILVKYKPGWLAFNHSYTFTLIVYGIIFLLWLLWIKYFTAGTVQTGADD